MAKKKYYAVRAGRTTGIFETWADCQKAVTGFKGADFKSFETKEDAISFMERKTGTIDLPADKPEETCTGAYAFTDGSYNTATKVYGFGGFLMDEKGEKHILQGNGNDAEMASMRNVAGEILGAAAAIELAEELGIQNLTIYYDYMGVEKWAIGEWKANKTGTQAYAKRAGAAKVKLSFQHVKGHTGVDGNEEADVLAKQAVGLL